MNRQGVLLDEVPGFDDFLAEFRQRLQPIFKALFPELLAPPSALDSHKAFVVQYSCDGEHGSDVDLAEHFDNSEVTINVPISQSERQIFTEPNQSL
jgi:hypothetical protein